MSDDDMPSVPLSRDAACAVLFELLALVPEPVLREELRHAAIDYAHAAATEALNTRSRFGAS